MIWPEPPQRAHGDDGDHLPEDRLAHPLHLAGAPALVAGDRLGAAARAGGLAGVAGHRGAHRHGVLAAEHRLGRTRGRRRPRGRRPGAARPARRPPPAERAAAEERLEDVADAADRRRTGRPTGAAVDALGPERVVAAPLLGVGQHLVGVGDLLEPGLGLGVAGAGVGVELAGQAPVGALDLLGRGAAGDARAARSSRSPSSWLSPRSAGRPRRLLTTATAASACG